MTPFKASAPTPSKAHTDPLMLIRPLLSRRTYWIFICLCAVFAPYIVGFVSAGTGDGRIVSTAKIIDSGDPSAKLNFVIMSEGYKESESTSSKPMRRHLSTISLQLLHLIRIAVVLTYIELMSLPQTLEQTIRLLAAERARRYVPTLMQGIAMEAFAAFWLSTTPLLLAF